MTKINQTPKYEKIEENEKRLTLRLPKYLYDMIADCAETEDISVNWWIAAKLNDIFCDVGREDTSVRLSDLIN